MRIVDGVSQIFDLGKSRFPFSGKNVGRELAPVCGDIEFKGRGEDEEVVEEVGGIGVGPKGVLILTEVIKRIYLIQVDL